MDVEYTPDPARYAWTESGVLVAGELTHYAQTWETAHYSGGDPHLSPCVFSWDGEGAPVIHQVGTTRNPLEDDRVQVVFSVDGNDEKAFVTLDNAS